MPKGVRRLPGFDETVLALYARGLTTRELQGYLEERYQVPVSPDLISTVTSEVMEEVTAWQRRPLDPVYIAVVFDALRVKIRGEGVVQNKAVYLALGVLPDGTKEVLGLWIAQTEGAAFWHRVFSELQSCRRAGHPRGDDRWPGGAAGGAAHGVSADHDPSVCRASGAPESAVRRLEGAETRRCGSPADLHRAQRSRRAGRARARPRDVGGRFPQIAPIWERAWDRLTPSLLYPLDARRVLYTTNAIESLNSYLRKPLRTRGHFPNDEAATKLLYLVLRTIGKKWQQRPAREWQRAVPHLQLLFGDRFPLAV
ncbi:hypothetical protein MASR1M101_20750 [Gemmatimonas sp.]